MAEKILSNKQINIAVKKIAQQAKDDNMPIAKAFMFGSYAQNKAKKYSDLDLCFVSPSFKDTFKAEVRLSADNPVRQPIRCLFLGNWI